MSGPIITIGEIPTPADSTTRLRARILELLARGVPRSSWDDRGDGWWYRPGALPWWEVRTRVGGRVAGVMFVEAVEGLIGDGLVIEAWLAARGRRTPSHVLLLPGHSDVLNSAVVRARGRAGVLANEPWSAALERQPWPEVAGADPGPMELGRRPGR
jgi:hypothetical protein